MLVFLEKYYNKYSDTAKVSDAVKFFDMDNDKLINPVELQNMLETFGTTENSYIDEQ